MKISILAVGTRGDIQPCVALAIELQKVGVDVFVATHTEYKELVVSNNVEYFELPGNPATKWDKTDTTDKNKRIKVNFVHQLENYGKGWLKACLDICQDSDAIIYTPLFFVGNHLAEKLNIPFFPIIFEPNITTSAFPSAYLQSDNNYGSIYNRFTHNFAYQMFWQKIRKSVNRIRKDILDLPPSPYWGYFSKMHREHIPFLCSFSQYLVPKPPDWKNNILISGYWFLEKSNNFKPSQELVKYFDNGSPPIYFDFGSFAHDRMKEKVKIIVDDLIKSNERLIIDPGKINISEFEFTKETIIIDSSIQHDWLLPKVKAIITHGGIGAIHAAMCAGVPTIPITIFPAQYFWGKKSFELGLGSSPLKIRQLKPKQVLNAILFVNSNAELKSNLLKMSKNIDGENGAKNASDFIIIHLKDKGVIS